MNHPSQRFSYRSLDELLRALNERGAELPHREDLSVLSRPVSWGRLTVPNRLAVQPMEGCDGTPDGAPTDLTVRRYRRFAECGAGLLWWEACDDRAAAQRREAAIRRLSRAQKVRLIRRGSPALPGA